MEICWNTGGTRKNFGCWTKSINEVFEPLFVGVRWRWGFWNCGFGVGDGHRLTSAATGLEPRVCLWATD
jgi:hypothetical protein